MFKRHKVGSDPSLTVTNGVRKLKAHRAESNAADERELREIHGNDFADDFAKQAAKRGARPEAQVGAHDEATRRVRAVVMALGRLLDE